jgi:hypothetical protein
MEIPIYQGPQSRHAPRQIPELMLRLLRTLAEADDSAVWLHLGGYRSLCFGGCAPRQIPELMLRRLRTLAEADDSAVGRA